MFGCCLLFADLSVPLVARFDEEPENPKIFCSIQQTSILTSNTSKTIDNDMQIWVCFPESFRMSDSAASHLLSVAHHCKTEQASIEFASRSVNSDVRYLEYSYNALVITG